MSTTRDRRRPIQIRPKPEPPQTINPIPIKPWLTSRETEKALNISPTELRRLRDDSRLPFQQRTIGRHDCRFRREDVERYSRQRASKPRFAARTKQECLRGRLPMDAIIPGETLISTKEAAAILQLTVDAVRRHIYSGRLFAYQPTKGKSGSPCFLNANAVYRLKQEREDRQKARQEKKMREPDPIHFLPAPFASAIEEVRKHGARAKNKHGEFLSTRQAAKVLGVAPVTINGLRIRGRLTGYHFEYVSHNDKRPGYSKVPIPQKRPSWWFYKPEDIQALKQDPAYQKRHHAQKRGASQSTSAKKHEDENQRIIAQAEECLKAMRETSG